MLKFDISHDYKGIGVSEGLERGLLVYKDDVLLLEEGMGIGICALQTGGYTYFTSIKSITKAKNSYDVLYSINKRLEWKIFGFRSRNLTKALEYIATNLYMKNESGQKTALKLGTLMRKLFRVEASFMEVPSLGEVKTNYEISDYRIIVNVSCETNTKSNKLFIMNELGGGFFNKALLNGESTTAPSGWQKLKPYCEIYSEAYNLAFRLVEEHVPDNLQSTLFWGREFVKDSYCWSGFESEINWNMAKFENYRYSIVFREVAK